mgnify:CR=1 FL=1
MGMRIGMNGRFFPANWRPALDEIRFAAANGFEAIQWRGPVGGLGEKELGAPIDVVVADLQRTGIEGVMELLIRVNENGDVAEGGRPIEVLRRNLLAIERLGMTAVHWHLVPAHKFAEGQAEVVP